jgi:hypothetical protein
VFPVPTGHLTEATTHLCGRVSIAPFRGPAPPPVLTQRMHHACLGYSVEAWREVNTACVHDRLVSGQKVGQPDATRREAKHGRPTVFTPR